MKRILFFVFALVACKAIAQELQTVIQRGHLAAIKAVAYTPGGQYLLTGSRDKTIKLWGISTGRELRTFFGHDHTVNDLDVAEDGLTFVSSGADGRAILWEIATGKKLKEFSTGKTFLTSVDLSPDGKYLATAGYANKAYIWNIETGDTIRGFKVNPEMGLGFGTHISFSADASQVIIGNDNRTVTSFEVATGKKVYEKKPETGWCGGCATFLATKGNRLVTVSNGDALKIRNTYTGEEHAILLKPTDDNTGIDISNSGQLVLNIAEDTLKVISTSGGKLLFARKTNFAGSINDARFSPDGKNIAVVADDLHINIYDAKTGEEVKMLGGYWVGRDKGGLNYDPNSRWDYYIKKYTDLKNDFAISPGGEYLAKGKIGSIVRQWHIKSGKVMTEFHGHEKAVLAMQFNKSGNELITGSADHTIKVWDVATGESKLTLKGHREVVFYVGYSSDESKIVSGSWDGTARVWDTHTGELLETHIFEQASPFQVSFFRNDLYAIIAGLDKTLKLYEWDSKKFARDFIGHTDVVHAYAIDGNKLASVSWDGYLKIWDIASGLQSWKVNLKNPLYGLAFNHTGSSIAVGASDRDIYLYDSNGNFENRLTGHQAAVTNLQFGNDDNTLVSSSEDGVIKIWDLSSGKELLSYITFDDGDWMAINTDGYFNATDGAFDKVAFVRGMKSYGTGQFFNQFYQPDLIEKTFKNKGDHLKLQDQLRKNPPPALRFLAPHAGESFTSDQTDVLIKIEDQGGGVESVRLMHNGKAVAQQKVELKGKSAVLSFSLNLIPGSNKIAAAAVNKNGLESGLKERTVHMEGTRNPSLYIMAVGINNYENKALNLNYAKADAEGFVDLITEKSRQLFDRVEVIKILDTEATKEEILKRLNMLSKVIKPEDVLFFYYAGHGSMVNNDFYFIPTNNVKLYSEEKLKKNAIYAGELQQMLTNVSALKQLLIIDACQSGGGVELLAQRGAGEEKALAQLSRSAGIHVLASAGSEQFAVEFSELGHGLFTYVLLEALSGKADGAPKDGKVTIYELKSYLDDQVPEFSKKYKGQMQFPHTFSRGQDFPVVIDEN